MYDGVHFLCVFNCLWKAEFSSQPISEYWYGTTTFTPFLQAINISVTLFLYLIDRFAFLIEDTSYAIVHPAVIVLCHADAISNIGTCREKIF